jgi:nucleoside-diphosphate-sugar epimerase
VQLDDLVELYILALASAPAGAFYFAENGENSMRQVCEAINRRLGVNAGTVAMPLDQASREWGEARRRIPWAPIAAFARSVPEQSSAGARTGHR